MAGIYVIRTIIYYSGIIRNKYVIFYLQQYYISPPARWGLLDFMSVACSSPLLSSCSTATLDAQCSLSDLNHDHPCPVFPAGPQPRPSPPSVPCRTSTTTIHAQCSLPDLNREYPRQVFPAGPHVERAGELAANSDVAIPEAEWRIFSKPSAAMARKVAAFEKSAGGFKLAPEQLSACRWFGEAMDVALQEEENKTPLRNRAQHACLLIGTGGTGKTTIILELMLDLFCRFFPARPGEEERHMIATFSHAQSDIISNDVYRARTCHTACSYRVASLRNKHLALKTKE